MFIAVNQKATSQWVEGSFAGRGETAKKMPLKFGPGGFEGFRQRRLERGESERRRDGVVEEGNLPSLIHSPSKTTDILEGGINKTDGGRNEGMF